jgi:hypothetical protein
VRIFRIAFPAAIAVAGIVCLAIGSDASIGAGIVLIGIAGLVAVLNALIRLSVQSQRDRDREEERRNR